MQIFFLDMIHAVWIQRWSGHNPRTNIRFHFWYIFNIVGIFLKKNGKYKCACILTLHTHVHKDTRMIITMTNALAKGRF